MYNKLDTQDKAILLSFFKKELDEREIAWIKQKMEETSAIKDAMLYAKKLGFEALEAIQDEEDVGLKSIITEMIERNF